MSSTQWYFLLLLETPPIHLQPMSLHCKLLVLLQCNPCRSTLILKPWRASSLHLGTLCRHPEIVTAFFKQSKSNGIQAVTNAALIICLCLTKIFLCSTSECWFGQEDSPFVDLDLCWFGGLSAEELVKDGATLEGNNHSYHHLVSSSSISSPTLLVLQNYS